MTSTTWKLATALGVAGAIALSVPSAEARGGRNALGFGIAAGALALGAVSASQPRYYYQDGYAGGPYGYQPYVDPYGGYESYNSYDAPPVYYAPRSYGNRNHQVPGTNYNPNQ